MKNENRVYHYDGGREELIYSRKEETSVQKSNSNIEENCSTDDFFELPSPRTDGQNLKENFSSSLSFKMENIQTQNQEE